MRCPVEWFIMQIKVAPSEALSSQRKKRKTVEVYGNAGIGSIFGRMRRIEMGKARNIFYHS